MNNKVTKIEFLQFMKNVAANNSDTSEWQKYAVQHYDDNKLEDIRALLVKICINDDNFNNSSSQISEKAVIGIGELISEFEKYSS